MKLPRLIRACLRPINGSPQVIQFCSYSNNGRCWVGWPSATYRQMRHRPSPSRVFAWRRSLVCLISSVVGGNRKFVVMVGGWFSARRRQRNSFGDKRYRVRCANHSPSAVTWPADDGRRRRRRRRDHTRIIIVILVAAANANATAGGCYTAIAKTEFSLHFSSPSPPRTRSRRGRRAATAPPQQQNTATGG